MAFRSLDQDWYCIPCCTWTVTVLLAMALAVGVVLAFGDIIRSVVLAFAVTKYDALHVYVGVHFVYMMYRR